MRAVSRGIELLFFVVIMIIAGIFLFNLNLEAKKMYFDNATEMIDSINPSKAYGFNDNWLIVNTSDPTLENFGNVFFGITPDFAEPPFCLSLKDCIRESAVTGKPCELVLPPIYMDLTGGSGSLFLQNLDECVNGDIFEETSPDVMTKVCRFKNTIPASNLIMTENDNCVESGDKWRCSWTEDEFDEKANCTANCSPFYNYESDVHGCILSEDFEYPITNSIYSYDPPKYNGLLSFKTQKTGGRIRAVVANATPAKDSDRTCTYNLFTCSYQGIASSNTDSGMDLFRFFRDLPETEFDCYSLTTDGTNYTCEDWSDAYNFTMKNNTPSLDQMFVAINYGLWEWNRLHYSDERYLDALVSHSNTEVAAHNYWWDFDCLCDRCEDGYVFSTDSNVKKCCPTGYSYDNTKGKCVLSLKKASKIQFVYLPWITRKLHQNLGANCWSSSLPDTFTNTPTLAIENVVYNWNSKYENVTINLDMHYAWEEATRTVWVTPQVIACLR